MLHIKKSIKWKSGAWHEARTQTLSTGEETKLSSHLLQVAEMGFGQTRHNVKCLVEMYVKRKGTLRGSTITNGWWQKFLKRNPMLKLRAGDSIAGDRMDAVNAENIHAYFDLSVRSVYDEFEFDDHPECIYNMDETGVPLEPRPPKIVAAKGQKKIWYRTSGQNHRLQSLVVGVLPARGDMDETIHTDLCCVCFGTYYVDIDTG